jgi:chromosome segregation ATPase
MQVIDEPILFKMLREWFDNLKPLYVMLNSLINKDKLSTTDKKDLVSLMKESSKSCQKIVDFENEIRYQLETLVNEVSALKRERFDILVEVDDFELKKRELASKNKLLKESVNESSDNLKDTIEKLKELDLQKTKLIEEIKQKKDEEYQLEQRIIEDKKKQVNKIEPDLQANLLKDSQNQVKDDIVIVQGGNMASNNSLSSRIEIMEIVLSMLDNCIPNLKQVWSTIREILECSDREVIDNKINSIGDLITDASKIYSDKPKQGIKQKRIEQESESIKENKKVSMDSTEDIDKLSKKLAFLNLECEAKEQKSNELLSKIEIRNIALSKLEEYLEVVKNDVVLLENKYNDITEKIKSLELTDKNNELLKVSVALDEEFYFDGYKQKLLSFYEDEKNKLNSLLDKSYEKLKNNERLLSIRQKELNIIDERTKKEFPDYEIKIANLKLKLSNKEQEIESLNNSIKEYIEKEKLVNVDIEHYKKHQDNFADEKESLLQKIIELEKDNKRVVEDNNTLKENYDIIKKENDNLKEDNEHLKGSHDIVKGLLHESQSECDDYKSKIKELDNKISKLVASKTAKDVILLEKSNATDNAGKSSDSEPQHKVGKADVELQKNVVAANKKSDESDKVIVEKELSISINSLELDKLKTELSEQTQKRNDTEKALLAIEKINVSLTHQISKRDNLIKEYEEEIQNLKEKLKALPETTL